MCRICNKKRMKRGCCERLKRDCGEIPKTRPSAGFSLVELMIVLSVLALLMSLLLPNMKRVMQSSKEVALKATVRSLQITLETCFLKQGSYPMGSALGMVELANQLILSGDLGQVPVNPFTGRLYSSADVMGVIEYSSSSGQHYVLKAFGAGSGDALLQIGEP